MIERATEILKTIQKLNPAEKHRLREYLIEHLLHQVRLELFFTKYLNVRIRMAMNVLIVHQNILFDSESIQQLLMVKRLKSNAIAVRLVKRHSLTSQIQFFIELVTLTNGVNLLNV